MAEWMPIWMFVAVCGLLLIGYPVAFTLASTALGYATLGSWLHLFDGAPFWKPCPTVCTASWATPP